MVAVADRMSDLSSLTRVQLETLKIHRSMRNGEINMEIALKMRRNSGIRPGTHYRILAQARKNIRESLFTVATAVQLGLVKPEDVQRFVSTVSLVPAGVNEEKASEVMAILEVLADRIVMS